MKGDVQDMRSDRCSARLRAAGQAIVESAIIVSVCAIALVGVFAAVDDAVQVAWNASVESLGKKEETVVPPRSQGSSTEMQGLLVDGTSEVADPEEAR